MEELDRDYSHHIPTPRPQVPRPVPHSHPKLSIITGEGVNIPLDLDLARHCARLNRKLSTLDAYDVLTVSVPFRQEVIQMALEYCDHLRQKESQARAAALGSSSYEDDDGIQLDEAVRSTGGDYIFDEWEFAFVAQEAEGRLVTELNSTAHFLGIARLLDLVTIKIMMMSQEKQPHEVADMFGVQGAQTGEDVVSALAQSMQGLKW